MPNDRVAIEGSDAMTLPQAKALLKAGMSVLMRSDFVSEDDTLTARERVSLEQAVSKLERCVRFH